MAFSYSDRLLVLIPLSMLNAAIVAARRVDGAHRAFEQIGERYGVALEGIPVVGDSARDMVAGVAAGCDPHLVLTGLGAALRGRALHPRTGRSPVQATAPGFY